MKVPFLLIFLLPTFLFAQPVNSKVRGFADTIGFAYKAWQMDGLMKRIEAQDGNKVSDILRSKKISAEETWKMVICPHDDHTYAGYMYPLVLKNVKARTIILFGVAHKARQLELQDKIIFDSFSEWGGCYGNIKVSALREKIISKLPKEIYEVNDSMQTIEHSVEGILPFLQYYNRDPSSPLGAGVEILSILVPHNSFDNMNTMAKPLAEAIAAVMNENNLEWGKDFAIVISNDAVHYGDEDWGGRNFARFGADSVGYEKATALDRSIIDSCIAGNPEKEKIKKFCEQTVKNEDYKEYNWTWCGRYSVPMGLLTGFYLSETLKTPISGIDLDYSTSLSNKHIKVDDLKLGTTAPAKLRHWVGYTSVGFR